MSYQNLITSSLLHLPITQNKPTFKESIQSVLNIFLDEVNKIEDSSLNIGNLGHIDGAFVKQVQKQLVEGLLKTIDLYYNGQPSRAFEQLANTLQNDVKNFEDILKIGQYPTGESFYRMRLMKGNFAKSQLDMFHIPFHQRERVSTQRYSIPGFPSLYLGRTLYGCWEEMSRPDINDFYVARLKNVAEIKYLDLTKPVFAENLLSKKIYHYFMTWPVIACCSIKVRDYSMPFKPEYIIPQLLLQWIREREDLDGIRFNSTHIDLNKTKSEGDFSNLVLPVKTNNDYGYCQKLQSLFEISQPISRQLYDHAIGATIGIATAEAVKDVDSRIPKLELIPGRSYPYSYSILGQLETYLLSMQTSSINFQ